MRIGVPAGGGEPMGSGDPQAPGDHVPSTTISLGCEGVGLDTSPDLATTTRRGSAGRLWAGRMRGGARRCGRETDFSIKVLRRKRRRTWTVTHDGLQLQVVRPLELSRPTQPLRTLPGQRLGGSSGLSSAVLICPTGRRRWTLTATSGSPDRPPLPCARGTCVRVYHNICAISDIPWHTHPITQ